MPRLLMVTMNFWPEPTGFGPMATDLAEHLADAGWGVTVLTGFPQAPGWRVYDGYRGRVFQRQRRGQVDVRRVWVYVPPRPPVGRVPAWKRIAFDTTFAASGLPVALNLPRHDAILAICPPLQTGLAALAIKRLWGVPVFYWIQDIVPDAAVSTGMLADGRAVHLGRALERFVYRGVDRIGIISEGFSANLRAKGVPEGKLAFLPNWADVARFDRGPDGTRTRARLGFTERDFVVVHAGTVGAKQSLEHAVRAMQLLRDHPEVHLLLVGDGNCLEAVKGEAARLGVSRVRFLPTTTGDAYVDVLRAADLLLIHQARDVVDALIPSKLLTYLPAGRPVLAAVHPQSEAARFVARSGCGLVVEPEAPPVLAEAILRLQGQGAARTEMGRRGTQYVRQRYDRPVLLRRFEESLLDLTNAASPKGVLAPSAARR